MYHLKRERKLKHQWDEIKNIFNNHLATSRMCEVGLNPLSPNIHKQILQTDLYTFPIRISWENLIKDQGIFALVIILLILITFSFDNL